MTTSNAKSPTSLAGFTGTLLLVGAGKMGGAMLEGWLALGMAAKSIAVIEPQPAGDIAALTSRGLRLNPSAGDIGEVSALVIAIKPQMAPDVMPSLNRYVGASTAVVSIMAGRTSELSRAGIATRRGDPRDAEHAGRDRPRHHGRGAESAGFARSSVRWSTPCCRRSAASSGSTTRP